MKKVKRDSIGKWLIIGSLAAVMLLAVLYLVSVAGHGEIKVLAIEDNCGQMVNYVSHTVADTAACRVKCRNQCSSFRYTLVSSEFIDKAPGCNSCTCQCRKE